MTDNPGIVIYLFSFLIVIGVLVFVHEMGHYLVGRWCGVKADTFSIGFGKEIAGWTDKRGTRWKVCMLPLGGYVQFAGDMDPSGSKSSDWLSLPAEERNRTFQSKSLWKRAAIVFAGPAINFIFAILIIMGFVIAYGTSATLPVASAISPDSTAAAMGMQPGDRIISVDGEKIELFEDLREKIMLGSLQAGLAFSNAILGAVHAMSHSLGGFLDLPHGLCNAILVEHVVAFNYASAPDRFKIVAQTLGIDTRGLTTPNIQQRLVQHLIDLKKAVGFEQTLAMHGVSMADLPMLSVHAMHDPCILTNPRESSLKDVEVVYAEAL